MKEVQSVLPGVVKVMSQERTSECIFGPDRGLFSSSDGWVRTSQAKHTVGAIWSSEVFPSDRIRLHVAWVMLKV